MHRLRTRWWGFAVLALAAASLVAAVAAMAGPTSSTGKKKIPLISGTESDDFYKAIECGAKTEAKRLGVDLNIQGPSQFDASLQIPIVNGVVARKPDAIIIAPNDDTALYPPLKAATDKGIKLILVDTSLRKKDIAAGHIGSNYVLYGVQGARKLAQLIGGSGTVLGVFSPPGVSTNDLGRKGMAQELKAHWPKIKLLPFQYSSGAPGKSAAIVSAVLAAHRDLKGIFTYNGGDAQGVVTALRQANASKKVTFVSGDAQPFQVEQLKRGYVKALVVQRANQMGVLSVQYALKAIAGKSVPRETAIPTVVGTLKNLSTPIVSKNLYRPC